MKKVQRKITPKTVREDILSEARVLKIHAGYAELIADKVIAEVKRYLESHPAFTDKDIEILVYTELRKYSKDLAYIYHNRDKII